MYRLVDVLVEVEGGEDQHLGGGFASSEQLLGGPEPVQPGHADVHQDEIGLELTSLGERLAAVGGLPHYLEIGLGLQDHAQATPHERLVVGDEYPGHVGARS